MTRIEALEAHGVKLVFGEFPYEGTPRTIHSVFLALTPRDWCSIAMRDGSSYIGGCCGTSSAIQDEVNGIFRESGYADADALYTIGARAKSHPDGFKQWGFLGTMSEKRFTERAARWKKLGPWKKIGLVYQAVKDSLRPTSTLVEPIVQEGRSDLDATREIDELYACIHMKHFALFLKPPEQAKKSGQNHANDVHTLAKMLPGARRLVAQLEANFTSWTGVAIVEKARPEVITHNGLGLCIYNTAEDAKEVMDFWRMDSGRSGEAGVSLVDKVVLRPLTISVQKGVEFLDARP